MVITSNKNLFDDFRWGKYTLFKKKPEKGKTDEEKQTKRTDKEKQKAKKVNLKNKGRLMVRDYISTRYI